MTHLNTNVQSGVATVTLSRPEVHNALNPQLIGELREAFAAVAADPEVRVVVLAAEGKTFCAGGDLNWMREAAAYTPEENAADAERLAAMLRTLYECPKPVIGRVQGPVYGGGLGLVAVCDMVAAVQAAQFCFSEVKLGLIPAVISPFVLRKVPQAVLRRYLLTADRLNAAEAHRLGLVSEIVPDADVLERVTVGWCEQLLANGPSALAACKRLLDEVDPPDWDRVLPLVSRRLAEVRAGEEAQEGVQAFLEKRSPAWRPAP
jgi:methylglutaconyl-CoA hydratase